MARARNIKPSLFKNELLGTADPFLTLLFEGLWCLADREGRLEDRPLRINAELFPYRGFSASQIEEYLMLLASAGFIRRYKVGDEAIIQVVKFVKHQSPHNTEKASELPPEPTENKQDAEITVKEPLNNESLTVDSRNNNALIPDFLNTDLLIPDSPNVETHTHERGEILERPDLPDAVLIYQEFFPDASLSPYLQDMVATRAPDLDLWRKTLTYWKTNKYRADSVGKMLDKYDELGNKNGSSKNKTNSDNGYDPQRSAETLKRLNANTL